MGAAGSTRICQDMKKTIVTLNDPLGHECRNVDFFPSCLQVVGQIVTSDKIVCNILKGILKMLLKLLMELEIIVFPRSAIYLYSN